MCGAGVCPLVRGLESPVDLEVYLIPPPETSLSSPKEDHGSVCLSDRWVINSKSQNEIQHYLFTLHIRLYLYAQKKWSQGNISFIK